MRGAADGGACQRPSHARGSGPSTHSTVTPTPSSCARAQGRCARPMFAYLHRLSRSRRRRPRPRRSASRRTRPYDPRRFAPRRTSSCARGPRRHGLAHEPSLPRRGPPSGRRAIGGSSRHGGPARCVGLRCRPWLHSPSAQRRRHRAGSSRIARSRSPSSRVSPPASCSSRLRGLGHPGEGKQAPYRSRED